MLGCKGCSTVKCLRGRKCVYAEKLLHTFPQYICDNLIRNGNTIISAKRFMLFGRKKVVAEIKKSVVFNTIVFRKVSDYYVIEVR